MLEVGRLLIVHCTLLVGGCAIAGARFMRFASAVNDGAGNGSLAATGTISLTGAISATTEAGSSLAVITETISGVPPVGFTGMPTSIAM